MSNTYIKNLLSINKKAFQFLHDVEGFDFENSSTHSCAITSPTPSIELNSSNDKLHTFSKSLLK